MRRVILYPTDAKFYRHLFEPFVENWEALADELLRPFHLPLSRPMLMARFGLYAIRSAYGLAKGLFRGERARALFAGLGGHSTQSLEKPVTAAFGLVMGISGHAVGWPMARGGSQKLTDALVAYFNSLGGEVLTNSPIDDLDQLPSARAVFLT
jgi:phytoene dehydrogenase-like protein